MSRWGQMKIREDKSNDNMFTYHANRIHSILNLKSQHIDKREFFHMNLNSI